MKLIATADFSQAANNPIGLPDGQRFIKKGKTFSIGGDLPFEKLSNEQQMLLDQLSHCICSLDSYQGQRILAEANLANRLEEKAKQRDRKAYSKNWHKRPVGIIIITVLAGIIVFIIAGVLTHLFPQLLH